MASSPLFALIAIIVGLVIAMTCAWVAEQRTGNAGWIDVTWTFGLAIVGALSALLPGGVAVRQELVIALVAVWALRSACTSRAARAASPTIRATPSCARLGRGCAAADVHAVQKQAIVTIPLALAICLAAHNPAPALRVAGLARRPRHAHRDRRRSARRCATAPLPQPTPPTRARSATPGCGRWSRHPNYFFEWFGWLAYPRHRHRSHRRYPGAGSRWRRPPACTGCWSMSPAFRRSKQHMLRTPRRRVSRLPARAPTPSFPLPPKLTETAT